MTAEELKDILFSKGIMRSIATTTHISDEAMKYSYPELHPSNTKTKSYYYMIDEDVLLELINSVQKRRAK